METIEEIKINETQTLKIYNDYDGESPREWDNMCQMICFHKRYNLGDKHSYNHDHYTSWSDMVEHNFLNDDIIVNLYLYDHSGITIATKPFGCRWDSGQVGIAVITKEKIIKEYGNDSKKNRAIALECLEAEIKTYNQYLQGEIYGFELVEIEECDLGHKHENVIESCWGFYGNDHEKSGLFDHAGYIKEKIA